MFKPKQRPGWMAIELHRHYVRVAHVTREPSARPCLAIKRSFERAGDDIEDLGRLRRALSLQHYRCTTSMDPAAYQVVQMSTPEVPASELNAALRWGLKDAIDFPPDEATIDSLPIPSDGAPSGRGAMVLAIAARRERISNCVRVYQQSGIPLTTIDIAETAQRNVAALFEEPDQGLAFLAFTQHGGLLTFTRNGELYAMRRIDVSGAALSDHAPENVRQPMFERIALELQRSLDHFDRLFSQVQLQRVLVAPHEGAASLVSHLRQVMSPTVELADLDEVLELGEGVRFTNPAEQAAWLQPIGLALREEVML